MTTKLCFLNVLAQPLLCPYLSLSCLWPYLPLVVKMQDGRNQLVMACPALVWERKPCILILVNFSQVKLSIMHSCLETNPVCWYVYIPIDIKPHEAVMTKVTLISFYLSLYLIATIVLFPPASEPPAPTEEEQAPAPKRNVKIIKLRTQQQAPKQPSELSTDF